MPGQRVIWMVFEIFTAASGARQPILLFWMSALL
jgi:hypothetical protein